MLMHDIMCVLGSVFNTVCAIDLVVCGCNHEPTKYKPADSIVAPYYVAITDILNMQKLYKQQRSSINNFESRLS